MEKVKRFLISILLICFGAVVIFAQERVEIKYGPYLQNLKETETTIVWVSNKPSIGWVELTQMMDLIFIKRREVGILILRME